MLELTSVVGFVIKLKWFNLGCLGTCVVGFFMFGGRELELMVNVMY